MKHPLGNWIGKLDDAYHVYLCYGVQIKFSCTHDVSQITRAYCTLGSSHCTVGSFTGSANEVGGWVDGEIWKIVKF